VSFDHTVLRDQQRHHARFLAQPNLATNSQNPRLMGQRDSRRVEGDVHSRIMRLEHTEDTIAGYTARIGLKKTFDIVHDRQTLAYASQRSEQRRRPLIECSRITPPSLNEIQRPTPKISPATNRSSAATHRTHALIGAPNLQD
jgi:hypothetical protein